MALRYVVVVSHPKDGRSYFGTSVIGSQPWPYQGALAPTNEMQVGRLFQEIKAQKRLTVLVSDKEADAVHMLLKAQQNQTPLSLSVALLRDDGKSTLTVADLELANARVAQFVVAGSGLYAVQLDVKGKIAESDAPEKLRYRVIFYGHKEIAMTFIHPSRIGTVPGAERPTSEIQVGHLFQAIKDQKSLNIILDDQSEFDGTVHPLLEAQQRQILLSFHIECISERNLADSLHLREVQVVRFLAFGSGETAGYTLVLKVTGEIEETWGPPE